MKKKNTIPYMIMFTLVAIGAFLMFVPYLWMVLSSFKSNLEIIEGGTNIFPKNPSLDGYKTVLNEAPFLRWLMNSFIATISVTVVTLFTSALAGYIFAKFKFRGQKFYFIIILATMMVPFQVTMIPTYLIISDFGLINNILALIIPNLVNAFGIFLSKQFIEGIPNDLIEAARIDGAGEFRTFWSLILPQIKPILSALAIFTFMATWNDYLWPLIVLNDLEKMTVPLALVFFNGQHAVNYNVVMSAAVLIMIPVVIVFLIFQKQFIKGMTLTGFK
ncbi:carbohydrate ABC transporter permease [Lederbergia citrea]|uniref:Carbohydrate ABC transporter permease n=1 Tax=Lederbergia citrea TaxID=2833581 RepID=A0A942UPA2_9BACI|nr:carbohydrate ABC transporter permease [Lederbergia citrea]MBS4177964.1 carbohydrate ABC transporter permease [Lederbergia citrea]MBS4204631.1 carbohydrate ABC transporter permease [Lederbergia citrea]MBS4223522.1 carbohydrate ABC transporter permease [Lederbergia citrea]